MMENIVKIPLNTHKGKCMNLSKMKNEKWGGRRKWRIEINRFEGSGFVASDLVYKYWMWQIAAHSSVLDSENSTTFSMFVANFHMENRSFRYILEQKQ